jgi:hypothetical protein
MTKGGKDPYREAAGRSATARQRNPIGNTNQTLHPADNGYVRGGFLGRSRGEWG